MRFIHTVQQVKVVDQHALDRLFNLPAADTSQTPSTKGIEPHTLDRIKRLFAEHPEKQCRWKRWWNTSGSAKPRAAVIWNTAWKVG